MTPPILGHPGQQRLGALLDRPIDHRGAVLLTSPSRNDNGLPETTDPVGPGPRVPLGLRLCVVGLLVTSAWAAALWMSTHIHFDRVPTMRGSLQWRMSSVRAALEVAVHDAASSLGRA